MKNILLWALLFPALVFGTDRILGYALRELSAGSSFRFTRVYQGSVDAEILILGNSRGVNSFYQPDLEEELNRKVFNMSYNGLRIDIARVLLEDYLILNKKPSTIILEASMLTKAYPELAKELKPYISPTNNIGSIVNELYPDIYRFSMVSHLLRYNSEMFLRSLYYLNEDDQRWINHGVIDEALENRLAGYGGTRFEVDKALLEDLSAVEALCTSQKIELKVIIAPYLPAYAGKIRNMDAWKASLNKVLKMTAVEDYSISVRDSDNFADWVHLNRTGSRVLLDILQKDHFFEE